MLIYFIEIGIFYLIDRDSHLAQAVKPRGNHFLKMRSSHPQIRVTMFKGTVHPQIIFPKYVMLRTVNKHFTTIITKYTWYHTSREIIQITGGPPLRLHQMPASEAGRRKVKCSDITWARHTQSLHRHQSVSLHFLWWFRFFLSNWNQLHLVMVLLAQTDMVVYHSWHNLNKIIAFCSGIIPG